MTNSCPGVCLRCNALLEPVQKLRYLVEEDDTDEASFLTANRRLPRWKGRPVPLCAPCLERIEAEPPKAAPKPAPAGTGVRATVGILSVALLFHHLFLRQPG